MTIRPPLRRVPVNGTELHYVEQGDGPAIVLVHGGLGDWRTWGAQLGPFAAQGRTIAYSRRGYYPNAWPPGTSQSSLQDHVDDLAALISTLNLGRAHLVANSYGGFVALMLAGQHPALVRTLVLAEPPVHPMLRRAPGGAALLDAFRREAWQPATAAFAAGDLAEGVRRFLAGAVRRGTFEVLPPAVREALMKNAPALAVETSTDPALYMPDITCADLARVAVPTLLLRGALSPPMYYVINDALAACLPQVEQATIPAAAHILHSQNPAAHNAVVLAFLARHLHA